MSIAAVCLLAMLASAYALSKELSPFLALPVEEAANAEAYASEDFGVGLSSYSREMVMKSCFRIVLGYTDLQLLYEPARNVVDKCRLRAAEVVERTPSDSFAWLVRAASSIRLVKVEEFNAALRNSQKTGPNEQWIARERIELAENFYGRTDDATKTTHETDLALMASSYRGVKVIARRYVSDPNFRARITTVVEKLPAERQRLFVGNVKKAMQEIRNAAPPAEGNKI
ncbi:MULTISPECIES: hypothetical protein [unclassified Rhizobium]|uniref:hypothetical protein n=1 Tax=unclassified Rhizobium TaxID=2613769 RepID=UPI0006F8FE1A|nr:MULTISPECIES: hypothetical protein [unclassified Rhizobium]KQV44417.1 hypothetical protein ASC86_06570 [Rhizobium sp. Root1212]KRD38598.1 hypothetical protein ASE37_06570 [Rhizobium sp. Root268]